MEKIEFEEKLVDLVREYPCLYNKKDEEYRNKFVKEKKWIAIGVSLDREASECKEIWVNLRGQFLAHRKKLENPTGSAANKRPFFRHEKAMEFCSETGAYESGNYSNVTLQEEENSAFEIQLVDGLPKGNLIATFDPLVPSTTTSDGFLTRCHQKFGGKHKLKSFEDDILNALKSEKTLDEFDAFFSSMAAKLRRINAKNPEKASELQLKIHQMIYENE